MKKSRNASLDLLRLIAMLMVVCNHLISWTDILPEELYAMTPLWIAKETFFVFLLPAVICFVLISGYFLCTADFKLKRLVSLWVQTIFYSVGIYLVLCLFHEGTTFSVLAFLKRCLPVTMNQYWFITSYFLMYALSPFLNILIQSMNKSTHLMCCITLYGIFGVAANLVYISDFTGVYGGYSFIWFCVMYISAAYIRLYVPTQVKHQKWMFPVFALLCLMICGEKFLAYIITPKLFGSVMLEGLFYSYNSILAYPCALALFQCFRGMSIRTIPGRIIGFFTPLALATYLIHGQGDFGRILLGKLDMHNHSSSFSLFPYLILCTIAIFTVSCAIEWARQKIFHLCKIDRAVASISDTLQNKIHTMLHAHIKEGRQK